MVIESQIRFQALPMRSGPWLKGEDVIFIWSTTTTTTTTTTTLKMKIEDHIEDEAHIDNDDKVYDKKVNRDGFMDQQSDL